MDISCPHCGYIYKDHEARLGKICLYCKGYIPPVEELAIVKENKEIKQKFMKLILAKLKQRISRGG